MYELGEFVVKVFLFVMLIGFVTLLLTDKFYELPGLLFLAGIIFPVIVAIMNFLTYP